MKRNSCSINPISNSSTLSDEKVLTFSLTRASTSMDSSILRASPLADAFIKSSSSPLNRLVTFSIISSLRNIESIGKAEISFPRIVFSILFPTSSIASGWVDNSSILCPISFIENNSLATKVPSFSAI